MLSVENQDYRIDKVDLESDLSFYRIPMDFSSYTEKLEEKLSLTHSLEKARDDIEGYFEELALSDQVESTDTVFEEKDPRKLNTGTLEVLIESDEDLLKTQTKNLVDKRISEMNKTPGKLLKRDWGKDGTLNIECLMKSHSGYR